MGQRLEGQAPDIGPCRCRVLLQVVGENELARIECCIDAGRLGSSDQDIAISKRIEMNGGGIIGARDIESVPLVCGHLPIEQFPVTFAEVDILDRHITAVRDGHKIALCGWILIADLTASRSVDVAFWPTTTKAAQEGFKRNRQRAQVVNGTGAETHIVLVECAAALQTGAFVMPVFAEC